VTGLVLGFLVCLGLARAGTPERSLDATAAPEVRLGIPLTVEVLGGERFDGAFVAWEHDLLVLTTRDGQKRIGLPLILSVEVEGDVCTPQAFLEGVRRWSEAQRLDALGTPAPVLVAGASVLWAGAGPAMLGRWKSCLAYSLVEASLLGAGGVMVAKGQYGPLLPLAALDVLVRAWAVGDSVHEAQRRRRRANAFVGLAPLPGAGSQGSMTGVAVVAHWPAKADSPADSPVPPAPSPVGLTAAGPFPY
jgi:hypothetical protein